MKKPMRIRCVGDLILDVPQPEQYFSPEVRQLLREADCAIGQVEIPHTTRGVWSNPEASSASAGLPEYLDCMPDLGFKVATLAGNHIFDQGTNGVVDTISHLNELGIASCGAGINLTEAVKPAFYECDCGKIGVLNYNTVGPMVSWATPLKAGCAFLKVATHYESDKAEPGGAPTYIYTITDPACLQAMTEQIRQARQQADAVICAFHMGRMFSREILQYQTEICHRAIDAGASGVICCHAHNLLGAELYRGKPIFYGMGHFVAVTETAMPDSWIRVQHEFRPFNHPATVPYWKLPVGEYRPGKNYYMFNEESRLTMIAELRVLENGDCEAGFIPCRIVEDGKVVVCTREDGEDIRVYMEKISACCPSDTEFRWDESGRLVLLAQK